MESFHKQYSSIKSINNTQNQPFYLSFKRQQGITTGIAQIIYIIQLFNMYQNLQNDNFSTKNDRFSKCINLLLLLTIILVLLLNVYELATFDFQAGKILTNFRLQQDVQAVEQMISLASKREKEVGIIMDKLRDLIDQEQFILIKIIDSYIQVDKEEDEIPEIVAFKGRLKTQQQSYEVKFREFKTLSEKMHRLKSSEKQYIKNSTRVKDFRKRLQQLSSQINLHQSEIQKLLKGNQEWYNFSQTKLTQQKKKVNFQLNMINQDIEDLPQYYNLPALAQEILKPLPIELLKLLYSSQSALHQQSELQVRQNYYKDRQLVAKQNQNFPSFSLTKYNIRSGKQDRKWQSDIINDYAQANRKYSLDDISTENGFCIIVPTFNNVKNFKAQLNLNSIFAQNYTNYKVVIIDDASKDKTPEIIRKYLKYYNISSQKCQLLINQVNKKALQNIYYAIDNHCQGYDIVAIVDGDDQLIGFNVLKILNAIYSRQKLGVVYSNFYFYNHIAYEVKKGFNSQYTKEQKHQYRETTQKFSHLISFKTELLKEIKREDLQYSNGKFFQVAYDFALLYPLMELSCGHVKYIEEFQYLYAVGTGQNDYQLLEKDQKNLASQILKKKPYPCSQKYKD